MAGKIIVICAPSGTGKSTLITQLKNEYPELKWSVSHTTRAMRAGEEHGKDYFFITVEEFENHIKEGNFIEWFKVHNDYKGSSRIFVDNGLQSDWIMLFDVDVQGADALKSIYGSSAKVIFIEPPSIEELEKRLRSRQTDSEEQIQLRIENAKKELARKNDYDFLILNDEVDQAYKKLKEAVERILK